MEGYLYDSGMEYRYGLGHAEGSGTQHCEGLGSGKDTGFTRHGNKWGYGISSGFGDGDGSGYGFGYVKEPCAEAAHCH